MSERIAFRTCPLCEATCGLEITLVDEEVKVIRGDQKDAFSRGYICPKGTTLGKLHTDPDRLAGPVMKLGGAHVPVSWDDAYAAIDAALRRVRDAHGNDAVGIYVGNPNAHNYESVLALKPLIKGLGTKNVFSASTVDQRPREVSNSHLYGGGLLNPVPDLDRTDFILILGANPYESNGSLASAPDWPGRLEDIRARGGKVVVVDPRRTKTAENADEHIPIRPATDAALLLAMANVIVEDGLVSLGRLEGLVSGVDDACAHLVAVTPERVAGSTGIDALTIRRLAHELAAAERACVYGRIGTHTTPFGTLAAWSADLLNILTGNLDRPGGVMFPSPIHEPRSRSRRAHRPGRWQSRVRGAAETFGELPAAVMAEEIETPGQGQIRMMVTVAGNPVLTTPEGDRLGEALDTLEFMVSVDPYLNETTRHADVVLPPPSALARSHYDLAFASFVVRNHTRYSPSVFPADGPSEFEILVRLTGIALGMGTSVPAEGLAQAGLTQQVAAACTAPGSPIEGRDPEEILEALNEWEEPSLRALDFAIRIGAGGDGFGADADGWSLAKISAHPNGIDLGPLVPRLPDVLATPTGTVELAAEPILADIDRLLDHLQSEPPELALVGRRDIRSANSWLHNVEVLVKGRHRCTLEMHPADAARVGLTDGDMAEVSSDVGTVELPVSVTDSIAPGVVCIPYGWGHDVDGSRLSVAAVRPGVNVNRLTPAASLDPLSGNATLNGIPVRVKAVSS